MLQQMLGKVFGTKNDRELKKYAKRVKKINALEPRYEKLNDDELKDAFNALKVAVLSEESSLDDVHVESFAITREAGKRALGMRHIY